MNQKKSNVKIKLRPFQFLWAYKSIVWAQWMEAGGALMAIFALSVCGPIKVNLKFSFSFSGLTAEPCRKPDTNNWQLLRNKLKLKFKYEVNLRFETGKKNQVQT